MLSIARAQLDEAGITHASVRQGDILNLPLDRESFDVVTIHQVLHSFTIRCRRSPKPPRMLRPGGSCRGGPISRRMINEELRTEHAHARLGFSQQQVADWLRQCGLTVEKDRRPARRCRQ